MATGVTPESMQKAGPPGDNRLAAGALGLPQVLFCIVTGAAPIAAMLFNTPVAVLGSGWAAPATFVIATVALTIFSVGYVEMAKRVTAAGGFYSFATHAFGSVVGMGVAFVITAAYIIFSASVIGVTAYFANTTIQDWLSVDVPVFLLLFVPLIAMAALSFFHVELTAKLLGIFLAIELVALIVFGFAVLFQGGHDGLSLRPILPWNAFADNNTHALGAGIGLFAGFWSWVGFEMAPNYAEEAREPKKVMGPATYISVIGLGVLYVFITWMLVTGWGMANVQQAVTDQFGGKFASIYYPLTTEFFGRPLLWAFELTIVTGSFACQFAFFNTANRYLYSMGREGVLPRALGRTHPVHKSPYIASMTVTVLVGLYVLGFWLYDGTTLAALTKLGTWGPLLGVSGILVVQGIVSVGIIKYFATVAKDGQHIWRTIIAPAIGAVSMVVAAYLMLDNRGDLSGAANVPFIRYLWLIMPVVFLAGVLLALYYKSADAERYEGIGRYLHEDA